WAARAASTATETCSGEVLRTEPTIVWSAGLRTVISASGTSACIAVIGNFSSVFYADQKEAARRRGGGCSGAIAQIEDPPEIFPREIAFADHQKCSDEVSNHMVEEAIPAYGVDQLLAIPMPLRAVDGAHVIDGKRFLPGFGIHRGEGSEIVLADHNRRSCAH